MVFSRLRRLALPSAAEVIAADTNHTPEQMTRDNRVVVYGSRRSGAIALAAQFEEFLAGHDIQAPVVHAQRDASLIEAAFFGLVGVGPPPSGPTLPRGVLAMPEMRQYTPSDAGMTIPTPYDYIQRLCDQHKVPMVRIDQDAPLSIGASVVGLLAPAKDA